ncbi:TIGR03663 family protein [Natronomonas salina]|uniref:flippase activity-associated protein Agl23 n=1 Tax=Natronomonas salina TaxID=1710540 RepID=UPI0015B63D08|nr:flippase activity-associated protein Agl23 [Natronomonas salina]QLD88439.1 TIGR03663 family protein [Natronomonas salina]
MNDRRDRTLLAVVGLAAVALALRLAFLGSRVAHWDEGRVAYWIADYAATGVLFYRPIIHGPLLHLVNAPLFKVLGATDTVMRLVPALLGGLLPLTALLFRHRLRDASVVGLALFLALDPVLLYYSRFMRSDVPVAAACFVAFACLVRAVDFDDGRYLYPASFALAVGFGAKENALAYLLAFVGATGLLLGHRIVVSWVTDGSPAEAFKSYAARTLGGVVRHGRSIVGSAVLFLATFTYLYAPRGSLPSKRLYYFSCLDYEGHFDVAAQPTLGEALANPLQLPRLVYFTLGSTGELYACQWITPRQEDPNPYLEFLGEMSLITAEASAALVALAVVGFLATMYASEFPYDRPDDLVAFCFYWGAASMVGYPVITDIGGAAWLVVHIVLPLAVPAAFGIGVLYRWGGDARVDGDTVSVALAVALAVLVVGSMAWTGYATSFADPKSDDNSLVQYAQPSGDVEPTLAEMRTLADRNDGTDVVLYGGHLHDPTGDEELERRPTCADWFNALPLPWYFESGEMDVDCAPEETALEDALAADPPVVIAHRKNASAVDERIDDRYERREFRMRTTAEPFVYYVDVARLE